MRKIPVRGDVDIVSAPGCRIDVQRLRELAFTDNDYTDGERLMRVALQDALTALHIERSQQQPDKFLRLRFYYVLDRLGRMLFECSMAYQLQFIPAPRKRIERRIACLRARLKRVLGMQARAFPPSPAPTDKTEPHKHEAASRDHYAMKDICACGAWQAWEDRGDPNMWVIPSK